MKVALYIRVSTEEQAKEGFSISAQKQRLSDYASSQGWKVVESFIDDGYSAKDLNRPNVQKMIKGIEKKQFDVVLVYRLDRLVRSVIDLHSMLQLLDKYDVKFKSATEMFDTTTAMGRFFITLVGAMAEWERDNLGERTMMGMSRRIEEGQRNGGNAPFGYDLVEGELVVNEDEARWVRFIFDQFEIKGRNVIAKELNRNGVRSKKDSLFNPSMVTYIAKNPVYYGMLRWNYRHKNGKRTYEEVLVPGKHEPIITQEQFDRINGRMKERANKGHKGHVIYPFSGKLRCKRCGKKLNGAKRKRANGEYRFYKCSGRFTQGICDMPVIGEDVVDLEFINNLNLNEIEFEAPDEEKVNVKEIEKELKKVRSRVERLEELYIDGDISKKKYKERLELEQKKETELIQSLEQNEDSLSADEIKETLQMLKENWSEVSFEHRKKWIHNLFDYIEIECHSNHKGGNDTAIIEITDYALAQ
jgi:site-specific DNA recombinase